MSNVPAFKKFCKDLGSPKAVCPISVTKTRQLPMIAMHINQSTIEGNANIIAEINRQQGLGQAGIRNRDPVIDFEGVVSLFHGDLGTLEKLVSLRESRQLEKNEEAWLQDVVFILGLFHLKMAAADALWRTYTEPCNACGDSQSMYAYVGLLRPKETGKFGTNPGFRRMHDVIHYITHAAILDCWWLDFGLDDLLHSLDECDQKDINWEMPQTMASRIVHKYVAGPKFGHQDVLAAQDHDYQFENSQLRNRDCLYYIELCHAMTWGDVRRVEEMFMPLICLFKATGKHKYAGVMIQFLGNLKHVYPPRLR